MSYTQSIRLDEEKHEYWLTEVHDTSDVGEGEWTISDVSSSRKLPSVTQLLAKHGLTKGFEHVDREILNAKKEYGTLVHKYLEQYIKTGKKPTMQMDEVDWFVRWLENLPSENGDFSPYDGQSERIVFNQQYAGTIDFMYSQDNGTTVDHYINDFKTSATLDLQGVRWQLSLYAYIVASRPWYIYPSHWDIVANDIAPISSKEERTRIYNSIILQCFHFTKSGMVVVPTPQIAIEEVERLLECESTGEKYEQRGLVLDDGDNLLALIEQAEKALLVAEEAKKVAETTARGYRLELYDAMCKQDIKSYETSDKSMLITRVDASTEIRLDSKALKADLPDIAKKYEKITNKSGYVLITLRDNANG